MTPRWNDPCPGPQWGRGADDDVARFALDLSHGLRARVIYGVARLTMPSPLAEEAAARPADVVHDTQRALSTARIGRFAWRVWHQLRRKSA